ncbi:acyl-CoA dehydrogenase family protein [Papillibacter cinnamivorans]|uniref:Acyl-CoA dehydrogenase n=1 Tax=Papillibacter cinnamivorans DSM 12816 TaxID=1122930 RepID=A0A1W2CC43_9FIRM|nr:acyl-CoA dehydrogenase family protein [Papillibacter cinnamivorans]SMC82750.1 Acyl-CoA dehydrogenase [Papillibacter cinnamivorans DSM 12816]
MGYLLTEQQEELRSMIDEFYTKELDPLIPEYEEKGETPMQFVKQGIQMGLHAMDIPEEYGGMGLDDRTTTILVEEMARHDAGVSSAFTITAMAMKCVLEMGSEEQKRRTGALITAGKIGAFCLTEPQAGSNAAALKTSAVRDGDHYVINGTKTFITNGGIADFFIVMAMTDKSKGVKGISAFIVERGPGVSSGKHENKMGMRLSNTTEVVFEDAVVPAENLLGKEGFGYITAMKALDGGRASVAASAIGIAQRALEEAVKYAKLRIAFGQPIGNFQAVQFMIADMEVGIEASRGLVEKFLEKKERGLPYAKEGAMCKLFATDTVMKVTTDAVQIFGGYGYSKDYPVEKLMRDAKVYQIFEGTNQIQRMVIAKFTDSEY